MQNTLLIRAGCQEQPQHGHGAEESQTLWEKGGWAGGQGGLRRRRRRAKQAEAAQRPRGCSGGTVTEPRCNGTTAVPEDITSVLKDNSFSLKLVI